MNELFSTLATYLSFPFVRNALLVGVMISACCGMLGVTLVLKRFSFIGDGLSHVAFGAMCVASVVGITKNMLVILPVTIICAVLLLRSGQNAKLRGDAAIALLSVSALAIGYLAMSVFTTSGNVYGDVCTTLFGSTSILTLGTGDVVLCTVLSLLVIVFYILFYNKIFCITFDEIFARATGVRVGLYNLLLATVIAVIIVLAMNLVGSLLISALVVFPALAAMRVCRSFKAVTVCATLIAVFGSLIGILVSILAGTPVGATVVAADLGIYALFALIGTLKGWVKV